jgi:hypothetical protein
MRWRGEGCRLTKGDNAPRWRITGVTVAVKGDSGWVDWRTPAFRRIHALAAAVSYAEFAVVRTNHARVGRIVTRCSRLMMHLLHRAAMATCKFMPSA